MCFGLGQIHVFERCFVYPIEKTDIISMKNVLLMIGVGSVIWSASTHASDLTAESAWRSLSPQTEIAKTQQDADAWTDPDEELQDEDLEEVEAEECPITRLNGRNLRFTSQA